MVDRKRTFNNCRMLIPFPSFSFQIYPQNLMLDRHRFLNGLISSSNVKYLQVISTFVLILLTSLIVKTIAKNHMNQSHILIWDLTKFLKIKYYLL